MITTKVHTNHSWGNPSRERSLQLIDYLQTQETDNGPNKPKINDQGKIGKFGHDLEVNGE